MPSRRGGLISLGAWLATRGPLPLTGLVVTGLVGGGCAVAALASGAARAEHLPQVSSVVVAWVGGVLLAYGASLRAVRRDRDTGIAALVAARGIRPAEYARARVLGLALVLSGTVGGAILLASLGALVASGFSAAVLRAAAGSVAYGVVFGALMAPLALATVGGSSRLLGYVALAAALGVPEALAPWSGRLLPPGWVELTSIPAALGAVRDAVASPGFGVAHGLRALLGLAAVALLSLAAMGVRVRAAASPGAP